MLLIKTQSQLKKNIFSGSFAAAGSILVSVIAYPVYLHFLGATVYGLWATLTVVISFSSVGNLGIDEALIKFIAEEYESRKKSNIIAYISTGLNMLLVNGIVIFSILMLFEKPLRTVLNLDTEYTLLFQDIFPYIVLLSIFILIVHFINAILKGLGRFDQASYILLAGRICALVVSILFFINGYKIWGLFWGQFLSFVFILIVSSFFVYRKIGIYYNPFKNKKNFLIKLFKFGGTITVSKMISMLLIPFIKITIARYIGLANVTYFEIANRIVLQIRSLFERGISAIMPEVSRLSVMITDAPTKISEVMKKVNKANLMFGISTFVLLLIIGEPVLKLWLAEKYYDAIAIAFRIIVAGYLINLLSVPSYYYFMALGKVKYCFINHSVQAVLNCVLILILVFADVAHFQLFVAAYSFSIALSAAILILVYYRAIKGNLRAV